MNNRAVIYARFSTDLQSEKSIEDQTALCRAFAERQGFRLVGEYHDHAQSGATLNRQGIQKLLADADSRAFDIIVVEALDRLSRDMGDLANLHRMMQFLDIKLVTVHEGEANTLTVGMRGLFAQLFREDNVLKVRRGMTGLITKGLTAGGRAYGYRPNPASPGKPEIFEDEAAIIRSIFQDYVDQQSPNRICQRLNDRGVKPPRGKMWTPSALIGSAERGSGILRNPIYIGRLVWNKNRMIKDPQTGRRISRPNPASDWKTADVVDLQIISDDIFKQAQLQLALRAHATTSAHLGKGKRPKHLLSGLLKCKSCGFGLVTAGRDKSDRIRVRCRGHALTKKCRAPRTFYLKIIEDLLLQSLEARMSNFEKLASLIDQQTDKHRDENIKDRLASLRSQIAQLEAEISKMLDWLLRDIGDAETISQKMKAQRSQQVALKAELADLEEHIELPDIDPVSVETLEKSVKEIRGDRQAGKSISAVDHARVRELVESVTVSAGTSGHRIEILVRVRLIALRKAQQDGAAHPILMLAGRRSTNLDRSEKWRFEPDTATIHWIASK
jgi:DNA invertase Pin-like site-specific DNA recombinase